MSSTPHANSGFMKNIFNGDIAESALHHFPFFNTNREDDYKLMAESILEWMGKNVDSLKIDHDKKLTPEILEGLKQMGLFGLIIPEKFGGSEFTQTLYTRTLEGLNTVDSSVTITVGAHSSIGLKGLYLYGTEEQKAQYMPKLATGEMIAAFALTEPGAGSDAAGIKTRAVRTGDHYVLNGSKLWITNGALADFFTVFAKEEINGEDKITAFIVTRDMGGLSHGPEEQKLGIKASSTVEIFLKDVKVPLTNILGRPGDGFKIAMGILNQGRLGLAGGSLGAMKSVFTECIDYAKNRKAFGSAVAEFGLVQNMITQMTLDMYTSEAMTYFTTNLVDSKDCDYSIEAAICKVYVTEASWRCLNTAMQMHGGNGYMVEYGLERKLRDNRIGLIFEGTNEILRLFIAMTGIKEIALQYQKAGKELQSVKNLEFIQNINKAIEKMGFLSDFALKEVKKTVHNETLEGFHSAFSLECQRLSAATHILSAQASRLIRTYGHGLIHEQLQLARLADIAIDTFLIACVLSRVNSVVEKNGGVEKNKDEVVLAKLAIRNAKARINQHDYDLKNNDHDKDIFQFAKKVCELNKYPFSIDKYK